MLTHREEPEPLQPWSPKICSAAQVARELVRRRSEDMDFLCAIEVVPPSSPVHCRLFSDGERSSRPTIAELVDLLVSASLATATPTTSADEAEFVVPQLADFHRLWAPDAFAAIVRYVVCLIARIVLFPLSQNFALPASRLMCLWHERQMPYRHVGICYVCHASEGLMLANREEPEQLQPIHSVHRAVLNA